MESALFSGWYIWIKFHQNQRYLNFPWGGGGQKPPIRGVTCDLWCPFSNSAELFLSKVMCENLVWIGWNRRYVTFQGGGGRSPLLGGFMWPAMPIVELGQAIPVKSNEWKFGLDWLSLSRVSVHKQTYIPPPQKKSLLALIHPEVAYNNRKHLKIWESAVFSGLNFIKIIGIWIFRMGGRNPLLGGLHVTCDAHFRTRLSCSSQKSCVKIWFRLVEIGGTWLFRGAEAPY